MPSGKELQDLATASYTLSKTGLHDGKRLAGKIASLADRSLKQTARNQPLACRPGCSYCCHRCVPVSMPEALAIFEQVKHWQEDRLAPLKIRLKAFWELAEPLRAKQFWNLREPCPFLEEGLCSIYERRPLLCRCAASTDEGICRSFAESADPRVAIPSPNGEAEVGKAITSGIVQAMVEQGLAAQPLPLAGIILALLNYDAALLGRLNRPLETPWEVRLSPKAGEPLGMIYPRDPKLEAARTAKKTSPLEQAFAALPETGTRYLLARITAPRAYRNQDEVDIWQERFLHSIDMALEAGNWDPREAYDALPEADVLSAGYGGYSMRQPMEKLGKLFDERIAKPLAPELLEPLGPRKPGRIRVGFASGNLYHNSGGNWVHGWLRNFEKSAFETFVFKLGPKQDGFSFMLQELADNYYVLTGSPLEGCRFIRSLDLDYLIYPDLGDEGPNFQFAIFRLARRQALAWGCPFTSGLPSIDDYLSSDLMEPPSAKDEYTENLVRLPKSGMTYYSYPQGMGKRTREELGLPKGLLAVYCQNLCKLLPKHDEMMAEIAAVTGNPLVAFRFGTAYSQRVFEERMRRHRVPILWMDMAEPDLFHRIVENCDASLDAPDWSGGHTSFYTLQFRTPIVTMPSPYLRGRFASAYLKIAGVPEMIASSPEDYVRIAADAELLRSIRETMDPSALFGDITPVRRLQELIQGSRALE